MESATPRSHTGLDPGAVADEWIERAVTDFAAIARTKELFYRDIFEDDRWRDCYSFADHSRRYSSLIRLIFAGVKQKMPELSSPSSTEVNAWFVLFSQRAQLTEANVPSRLLPKNRGVSAALASATSKITSPIDRTTAQKAILQKMEQESEIAASKGCNPLPFTASTVREVAAAMGHRKHRITRPLEYRELDEMDPEAWSSMVQSISDLRGVVLSQLPAEQEHQKVLALARRLEGIALRPSRFVFGVFDTKECFTAPLVENFVGKMVPMEKGAKFAARHAGFVTRDGAGACWSSVGFDTVPMTVPIPPGGDLPEIACIGEGMVSPCQCSRIVLVMDEKAADKAVDSAIAALQTSVVPIPLAIWLDWESRGGIPVGTYVDEVLEPTVDDEPVDEQDELTGDGSLVL